eukprot:8547377-Karenia_brevis.AAC.1
MDVVGDITSVATGHAYASPVVEDSSDKGSCRCSLDKWSANSGMASRPLSKAWTWAALGVVVTSAFQPKSIKKMVVMIPEEIQGG